jgi:hypothetical protein
MFSLNICRPKIIEFLIKMWFINSINKEEL